MGDDAAARWIGADRHFVGAKYGIWQSISLRKIGFVAHCGVKSACRRVPSVIGNAQSRDVRYGRETAASGRRHSTALASNRTGNVRGTGANQRPRGKPDMTREPEGPAKMQLLQSADRRRHVPSFAVSKSVCIGASRRAGGCYWRTSRAAANQLET